MWLTSQYLPILSIHFRAPYGHSCWASVPEDTDIASSLANRSVFLFRRTIWLPFHALTACPQALRTPQFYLLWASVFGNAVAGVTIISCAKTIMVQKRKEGLKPCLHSIVCSRCLKVLVITQKVFLLLFHLSARQGDCFGTAMPDVVTGAFASA